MSSTSSASIPDPQAPAPARGELAGWLFGPVPDLLLGCGLLSLTWIVLQGGTNHWLERAVPSALPILLFALPHYGATLARVYESREDREKYRLFSVWATLGFVLLFVASLRSVWLGSLVLTIYLTWSPWHYSGQNYGIFLMLLGRRGVRPDPSLKRWIYASFITSYGLTFLAVHSGGAGSSYAPVSYGGTAFSLMKLGIPGSLGQPLLIALSLAYATTTGLSLLRLSRVASLRVLAPALVLLLTQAAWFSLPVIGRAWDLFGSRAVFDGLYSPIGFLWIAGAHALQYLWITSFYATRTAATRTAGEPGETKPIGRAVGVFLVKATLAGYAVWTLPALVFAPGLLGSLPHESGLALMVASVVNLHHFVLDGVIWKLRDGRVASVLLRTPRGQREASGETKPLGPAGPGWPTRVVQGLGALCVAYGVVTVVAGDFGFQQAVKRGDVEAARGALERLRWIGRDGPQRRTQLGRRLAREGLPADARAEFERSLAMHPTPDAWESLGQLREQEGRLVAAGEAYEAAAALQPASAQLHYRAGLTWLRAGRPARAEAALSRALELAPEEQVIRKSLERARSRRSDAARAGP